MSPTAKHYSMKSPPYQPTGNLVIDTSPSHHSKSLPQKAHRTVTPSKRPPGRPPKNKAAMYEPARPSHLHGDGSPFGMSGYGSPPHHHHAFGHRESPTAMHHAIKSPPPSHQAQGHSRPSHFSPPIPGRTGNVMTFSEALELVKHQSARKMEQAGTYDSPRTHEVSSHGNPQMAPGHQPVYTVRGRVYKRYVQFTSCMPELFQVDSWGNC